LDADEKYVLQICLNLCSEGDAAMISNSKVSVKIVTIVMLLSIAFVVQAEGAVYIFPVTPATPGWGDLTFAERIAVQQIPEEYLATMTTEDLYQTYLTLPGWLEHLASSSSPQNGFDMIRARYNVITALMKKPDVNDVLIAEYRTYVIDEINNYDVEYMFLYVNPTEIVLNQYEVIAQLTMNQKKELVEHALSIYNMKKSLPDSHYGLGYGFVLIGRIMLMDAYPPFMQYISEHPELKISLDGEFDAERDLLLDMGANYIDSITNCEDNDSITCELLPPAPNPFNSSTTISFTLPVPAPVMLTVYSITGQKVMILIDSPMDAGAHSVVFDGSGLSSGIYLYRFESPGFAKTGKMLMVK
jgi:hypothetical protein